MLSLEIQLQSLQNAIKESTKAMSKVVEALSKTSGNNEQPENLIKKAAIQGAEIKSIALKKDKMGIAMNKEQLERAGVRIGANGPTYERTVSPTPPPARDCNLGEVKSAAEDSLEGIIKKIDDGIYERLGLTSKRAEQEAPDHSSCDYEILAGFGNLLPYNQTIEAQLYAVRELALAVDVVDDHAVSLMLKKAIKQILERELDIDFSGDEKGSEVKPTIPQPKPTR